MIRQKGFAVLVVLWAMALLSLLIGQMALSGRAETKLAANLRSGMQLQSIADGAIYEAIFRLYQNEWRPDRHYQVTSDRMAVDVQVESQASKVNPNLASEKTLQTVLQKAGADPAKAAQLARSIVEWRTSGRALRSQSTRLAAYQAAQLPYGPSGRLFDSVEELGLVLGMTPDLLQR
ncbi:MAG: general secretion pathway protein GspK, partial [Rhodospirillales bacterium]|nr:general secretion pathway protein GspK [Acetobacter sp.]